MRRRNRQCLDSVTPCPIHDSHAFTPAQFPMPQSSKPDMMFAKGGVHMWFPSGFCLPPPPSPFSQHISESTNDCHNTYLSAYCDKIPNQGGLHDNWLVEREDHQGLPSPFTPYRAYLAAPPSQHKAPKTPAGITLSSVCVLAWGIQLWQDGRDTYILK